MLNYKRRFMSYEELWQGGPRYMQEPGVFPLGSDSVWLGSFAGLAGVKTAVDLGCGGGALSLMLLGRKPALKVTALDISQKAVELTRKNAELNGLGITALNFDPPYFIRGSGNKAKGEERAAAREENEGSLEDFCRAASYLCRWGGRFAVVYRPERLSELCCAMTANGIEPKRLRFVQKNPGTGPIVVLMEGKRGGKKGLKIEPPLILNME
jgi:tRNA1Val (adenine37-N6)-methyltransferase